MIWLVVGVTLDFSGFFSRTIEGSYRTLVWVFLSYGFLRTEH